ATNTVGGANANTRNLISGNLDDGVSMSDSGTSSNVVSSNYVGTNPAGTSAVANGGSGVHISGGAADNVVGGTTAGKRNLISGNVVAGVKMDLFGCAV